MYLWFIVVTAIINLLITLAYYIIQILTYKRTVKTINRGEAYNGVESEKQVNLDGEEDIPEDDEFRANDAATPVINSGSSPEEPKQSLRVLRSGTQQKNTECS